MVITFSSVKKNAYGRLANTRGEQTERTGKMREKLNTAKKKKVKAAISFSVGKRRVSFGINIAFSNFFFFKSQSGSTN